MMNNANNAADMIDTVATAMDRAVMIHAKRYNELISDKEIARVAIQAARSVDPAIPAPTARVITAIVIAMDNIRDYDTASEEYAKAALYAIGACRAI